MNTFVSDGPREPSLVLILKWGGELTPLGKEQAAELGRGFRCMYPGGQGIQNYLLLVYAHLFTKLKHTIVHN